MEFMKANTSSTLDFAQELLGTKSPSEALELWTSHTRKHLETLSTQAKELVELSQRVANDTAEPIKANAAKFYKPAA
jgi:phasin